MTEDKKTELEKYHLRARLPYILRGAALIGILAAVLIVVIGFYLGSFRQEFRMKSLPASLSENVVAVVNGYERKESDNNALKYVIRADKATTFDDQHQELENVFLEVFSEGASSPSDKLTADKAIYVPDQKNNKNFRIFFAGDVVIDTRDRLRVNTDQLAYTKSSETAEAEEYLEFSRDNISGNSVGAVVKIGDKTLELMKDVEIFAGPGRPGQQFARADVERAELRASRAFVDQNAETIDLTGTVKAIIVPKGAAGRPERPTRIKSSAAKAFLEEKQLNRVDLSGGVAIETANSGGTSARIAARNATYQVAGEVFELDGDVRIDSDPNGRATSIVASHAVYRQAAGAVELTGGAKVTQGTDSVSGERINAVLYPDNSLKTADIIGDAALRQDSAERKTHLASQEIRSRFGESGNVSRAVALGGTEINVVPLGKTGYSNYKLNTQAPVEMLFQADGKPASAKSEGRTTIRLTAVDAGPEASDKILTANTVNTKFRNGTDELETAEASGDAELVILPKTASAGKYRTEINSPSFVCDFYAANNARSCTGAGKSTARRKPLGGGPDQVLNAGKFIAAFDRSTQDIASLEAIGNAKFSEGERNGLAERIRYTEADETVRLRGGEPVIWDDVGRIRAKEIDWDVKNDKSAMSGGVSTTYYGGKPAGGSTPFTKVNSPVFVSSQAAAFDHQGESAVFTGNARAWQDKNYVRADRLLVEQRTGRFYADGNVQSLLYDAKRTSGGKRSSVPVYAESGSMIYLNGDRILRYEKNVDIRQGPDRIKAGTATVSLNSRNELMNTVVEKDVIVTQPGRKATGDYARYDAAEETIVLRGDPATVRDDERGSSSGREVTVNLKENLVTGTGKDSPNGTGRIRSVYKLKDGDLN